MGSRVTNEQPARHVTNECRSVPVINAEVIPNVEAHHDSFFRLVPAPYSGGRRDRRPGSHGAAGGRGAVAAESTQGSVALPGVAAASVHAQAKAQAKAADQVKQNAATVKKTAAKKAASWMDPVKSYKLSAGFGLGGNMWSHKHSGQDFAVPIGTNVMAAHGGTVVKAAPTAAATARRTATPS